MSVPKGMRGESEMEFLHTARELQIYTIRKCVSFPKRYTFYVSQTIAGIATRIYECVKMANSLYPTNAHEVQTRRDFLLRAECELNNLVSQIELANELFGIEDKSMHWWMDIIDREFRLVKGAIKKDRERYKDIV